MKMFTNVMNTCFYFFYRKNFDLMLTFCSCKLLIKSNQSVLNKSVFNKKIDIFQLKNRYTVLQLINITSYLLYLYKKFLFYRFLVFYCY